MTLRDHSDLFLRASIAVCLLVVAGCDGPKWPTKRHVLFRLAVSPLEVAPASGPVGDVNADGFGDVIVEDHVFSGRSGNVLYQVRIPGSTPVKAVSTSVGDIDGDRIPDFALGCEIGEKDGMAVGSVYVYSGASGELLYTFYGEQLGDALGASLAIIADLDGDGTADIVCGAPQRIVDHTGFAASFLEPSQSAAESRSRIERLSEGPKRVTNGSGYVRAFSGRTGKVLWTTRGKVLGDEFGEVLLATADLDADDVADVWAGTPRGGYVIAISGRTGVVLYACDRLPARRCGPLAALQDRDGDEVPELWTGDWESTPIYSGATGKLIETVYHGRLLHWVIQDIDHDGAEDLCYIRLRTRELFLRKEVSEVLGVQSGLDGSVINEVPYAAVSLEVPRPAGDIDLDGVEDFLVPGQGNVVYVLSGSSMFGR